MCLLLQQKRAPSSHVLCADEFMLMKASKATANVCLFFQPLLIDSACYEAMY